MDSKSFLNLDYIIEINEKRLDQYTSAYQKVLEKFTIVILIYSALTIFLVPIIKEVVSFENKILFIAFVPFALLLLFSLYYTVKLIIPVEVAYLEIPKKYYEDILRQYQLTITNENELTKLLKASYISELESAVTTNEGVFKKKSSFFYNALIFGLLAVLPYLVCMGCYITKKENTIQKIEIVNQSEISNFTKQNNIPMSKYQNKNTGKNNNNTAAGSSAASQDSGIRATHLPGVNNSQVIVSSPNMIKENKQTSSPKR